MSLLGQKNNMKFRQVTRLFCHRGALMVLSLLASFPAYSTTINVTSRADILADDGLCTLREAVIAANENFPSGGSSGECPAGSGVETDSIILTISGIYQFSIIGPPDNTARAGDLDLTEDVNIEGADAATFIINAAYLDRVFHIVGSDTDVVLRNITITGGRKIGGGGGIGNDGILTVEDAVIAGNQTDSYSGGGGIYHSGTILTLTRTLLRDNHAINSIGNGGGVFHNTGILIVNDCLFDRNSAEQGGAIYAYASSLYVTDTLFFGNTASRTGGAIENYFTKNSFIVGSAFVKNTADVGGAIYTYYYPLRVNNSTFNGNTANTRGGGLYAGSGDITLRHVTFDEGVASPSSAIYINSGAISVGNTLIAGRCDGGWLTSQGGNIETPGNTCGLADLTDQSGVSAAAVNLEPLKENGGKTPTQLPGRHSLALEGGTSSAGLFDDQRGVTRPQDFDGGVAGAEHDVGAVELLPCPHDNTLVLESHTIDDEQTFEACEKIIAGVDFSILSSGSVIMRSGNSIVFNPGFKVDPGARLVVETNWAFWENVP